jgi:hypothetical protein
MHHLAKVSLALTIAVSLAAPAAASAKKDYFTEDELELIVRVPVYFKLAERRLVYLGLLDRSAKEIEKDRKDKQKREKAEKKTNDTRATADKAPVDDSTYLESFKPDELLRGYIQVLDEVTTHIDDAYRRKLDVRDSLEDLAKFLRDTSPLLEKYKPQNQTERVALQDALDKAMQTAADTKEALNTVPKTEKKRKP